MTIEFEPVNIEDIPESTRGRNGAGSNELVDSFLASEHVTVKVNTGLEGLTGEELETAQKRTNSLRSSASTYVERLELPVKVFTRGGAIILHKDEKMPAIHAENKRQRAANRAAKAAEQANEAPAAEQDETDYVDADVAAEESAYADA